MSGAHGHLAAGRDAVARRMWATAYDELSLADEQSPLDPGDLVDLAVAAHLVGRDGDFDRALERAYHAHEQVDARLLAARCAFWLGYSHASRGEMGKASGWLGRAARQVERADVDCAERGFLVLAEAERYLFAGDGAAAYEAGRRAAEIGERFREPDLVALALHVQGWALIKQSRVADGLALLDEAMVAVVADELQPIVTGVIYCGVISACREVYALHRSREWTQALTQWCAGQPDLVPYAGQCLVHRAEVMQLRGAWQDALAESQRAADRFARGEAQPASAQAFYSQGEIYRLLGNHAAAKSAYAEASRRGMEPQPGLALLRLARHEHDAASAAIRRAIATATDPLERARLLPAAVEILLAAGEPDAAREACRELSSTAEDIESPVLAATAAAAHGAVELAAGNPAGALVALRHAAATWQEMDAPYETARVRELVGKACTALGDHDTGRLELDAAREIFERLGASGDVARLRRLARSTGASGEGSGLGPRELQVLRLVATGRTNKAIAAELVVSERTVDRHVSNILAKLGVSSRSAATAYAYEHRLV